MKAKLLIAISAILLFIASCQLDKPQIPASLVNQSIVGKWYYALDTLKDSQNGGAFKIISTSSFPTKLDYMQFNADGSGVDFYNSVGANFSYTIINNVLTLNYAAMTTTAGGITFTTAAFTEKAKIRSVTSSQLAILFDDFTTTNGVTEEDYEAEYFSK